MEVSPACWTRRPGANGRLSDADILSRVRWAKQYGKAQVLGARRQLQVTLDAATTHLPQCPLRTDATAEAAKAGVAASDVLTAGGTRATSPPELLLQLVEQASNARAAYDETSAAILARIAPMPPSDNPLTSLVVQGQSAATSFVSQFTMDTYISTLRRTLASLRYWPNRRRSRPEPRRWRPSPSERVRHPLC